MKVVKLLAVFLLSGCGTMVPLEDLERQALLTGDWSAVEKRERMIERREMRSASICPAGMIAICDGHLRLERCSCLKQDAALSIVFGH